MEIILANYKVCDQTEEFVNYSTLITSKDFKKKIETCERPNCHTKKYNIHDFSDKYEKSKNTTTGPFGINKHAYTIQAKNVNNFF